jgi:hypothetical protein
VHYKRILLNLTTGARKDQRLMLGEVQVGAGKLQSSKKTFLIIRRLEAREARHEYLQILGNIRRQLINLAEHVDHSAVLDSTLMIIFRKICFRRERHEKRVGRQIEVLEINSGKSESDPRNPRRERNLHKFVNFRRQINLRVGEAVQLLKNLPNLFPLTRRVDQILNSIVILVLAALAGPGERLSGEMPHHRLELADAKWLVSVALPLAPQNLRFDFAEARHPRDVLWRIVSQPLIHARLAACVQAESNKLFFLIFITILPFLLSFVLRRTIRSIILFDRVQSRRI